MLQIDAMQGAVSILGTAMTDMSRKDLSPEAMADHVVRAALVDAGIDADRLSMIIFSNALGGRLLDQGCIRGQSWLRKTGLFDVPVINVDNSCASGTSALRLANAVALATAGPVLVIGVEKMWTGDRAATLAGIEDGLPCDYRSDMRKKLEESPNPGGSLLMGLNDLWAREYMATRGGTLEHFAAAAAKAHTFASKNPTAQIQRPASIEEVLQSPPTAGVLTRLMCSSFTDGAAALVLQASKRACKNGGAGAPRIIGSFGRSGNGTMDYHDRLVQSACAAWEEFGLGPKDLDLVELHDATSAEELYAAESLGILDDGEAGPATLEGRTSIGGDLVTINPSGGLVGRGHPLGATGLAQVVELADQIRGRAGVRQAEGARLAVAVNTGGVIEGDAAYVGIHAVSKGA